MNAFITLLTNFKLVSELREYIQIILLVLMSSGFITIKSDLKLSIALVLDAKNAVVSSISLNLLR